jgi:hypothetical protein
MKVSSRYGKVKVYRDHPDVFLEQQHVDGRWDAESHDPEFGNVYSSALAVLALATPRQILPIYQRSSSFVRLEMNRPLRNPFAEHLVLCFQELDLTDQLIATATLHDEAQRLGPSEFMVMPLSVNFRSKSVVYLLSWSRMSCFR